MQRRDFLTQRRRGAERGRRILLVFLVLFGFLGSLSSGSASLRLCVKNPFVPWARFLNCVILGSHMETSHTTDSARTPVQGRAYRGLIAILIAFIATAAVWNAIIPPYENLDELEHIEVIRHLVVTGRLPVHDEAEAAGYHVRQEASQPPLYHVLAAGWARLLGLSTTPHTPQQLPGAVVACGPSDTFYNKASWRHGPFPAAGATGTQNDTSRPTVHALRAFSTLLQLFTLAGTWTLARRIFPRGPVPALATVIVGFNPQFLLLAAGVNNDNLVAPLATWGLVLGYDLWDRGPGGWRPWVLGLLSGLAALTKLSGLALIGVGGLALLVRLLERRSTWAETVRQALPIGFVAAAIVAPWVARNVQLYGDPTALAPMLDKVGRRTSGTTWGDARLMWLSYWGQVPCSFYPRALYWPYAGLTIGGLAPLVLFWRRLDRRTHRLLALCAIWFTVIVVAWIRWNSMTPAPGGRLLFPAIAALAVAIATGWQTLGTALFPSGNPLRKSIAVLGWTAFLPPWSLLVAVTGALAILGPPVLMPQATAVPNPISVTFGDEIMLRGYQAEIRNPGLACFLESPSYCAPILDLTLYWQAERPVAEDRTLVIQLVSAAPGATDLRLNYNHWPGRGNLATSAWPAGALIRDRYRLPLSPQTVAGAPSVTVTQAWTVHVAFVDAASEERLPVYVENQLAGDAVALTQVRVPDAQPAALEPQLEILPATFAGPTGDAAITLENARLEIGTTSPWEILLSWRSEQQVEADLTVFVHAYDADGALLAAGDGPPAGGTFPTRLWHASDRIISTHYLALDAGAEPARIAVGLYAQPEGARWPATREGAPVPDGAVVIWASTP
jgi:4-amino-4-deoxy-L-arabinose transferase-like glycosyltransferase